MSGGWTRHVELAKRIVAEMEPLRFKYRGYTMWELERFVAKSDREFYGWPRRHSTQFYRMLRLACENPKVPDSTKALISDLVALFRADDAAAELAAIAAWEKYEEQRLAEIAARKALQKPSLWTLMKRRNAELEAEVAKLRADYIRVVNNFEAYMDREKS